MESKLVIKSGVALKVGEILAAVVGPFGHKIEDQQILLPAEYALFHRLGMRDVSQMLFKEALKHPALPHCTDTRSFHDHLERGMKSLELFSTEYVKFRFPRLPEDSFKLAKEIYMAPRNLAVIGKSFGLDFALVPFRGIPQIVKPSIEEYLNEDLLSKRHRYGKKSIRRLTSSNHLARDSRLDTSAKNSIAMDANETSCPIKSQDTKLQSLIAPSIFDQSKEWEKIKDASKTPTLVLSQVFCALLGVSLEGGGAKLTRTILDKYLFTARFNSDLLCRPRNPLIEIHKTLVRIGKEPPTYRLLHESGRLSTEPVYCVGIYSGLEKIAESHGPSMIIARERSAIEALKKIYLQDMVTPQRPSDVLFTTDLQVNTISDLQNFFSSFENMKFP